MEILGSGMLAKGFARAHEALPGVILFACGVADSLCTDESQYERERRTLADALTRGVATGRTIIYFSSAGKTYGDTKSPADEETPTRPETAYGRHKVVCEDAIRASGARHLILRLPNVAGPCLSEIPQLVPSLARQAREGRARLHGHATRDLVHLDDVVNQTLAIFAAGGTAETFNLVSGRSAPVVEIFAEIQRLLGTNAEIEILPQGTTENFSNAKLARWTGVSFPHDYYRAVLARTFDGSQA